MSNGKGSARRDDFKRFNEAPYWRAKELREFLKLAGAMGDLLLRPSQPASGSRSDGCYVFGDSDPIGTEPMFGCIHFNPAVGRRQCP